MRTANKRLQMFLLKLNSIFFPTSSTDPPYLTSWHQRSPGRVSLVSHRYCPQLTNRHLQPSLTLGINILLLSHSSVRHQGFNSQLLETSLISGLSQVINQQSLARTANIQIFPSLAPNWLPPEEDVSWFILKQFVPLRILLKLQRKIVRSLCYRWIVMNVRTNPVRDSSTDREYHNNKQLARSGPRINLNLSHEITQTGINFPDSGKLFTVSIPVHLSVSLHI